MIIAILALIVLVLLYDALRMSALYRISQQLVKKSSPYQQSPANPTCRIVFLGDSTAVGTGSENEQDSVAGRFGSLYPSATIVNQGVNGQKIHELNASLDPAAIGKANLLVIQIGGNDILHLQATPLKDVATDLDSILTKASQISDHVVIMHTGNVGQAPFFPWYLSFIWKNRSEALRSTYIDTVKNHDALYIDLIGDGSDKTFSSDPSTYYGADEIHPSDQGYGVWFKEIETALAAKYGSDFSPCEVDRYAANF